MAKAAVAWSADEMKWESMPGVDGVQVAMLWGDMKKGAYGAIVKLPANQDHPTHTHSSTVKCVVLSGEFHYTPEGGTEKVLGPGSYLMVPAKLRHSSASGPDGVTMFQEGSGAWDMVPVAVKTAAH
jgi:quercetin dioxygenase-like cupin family protein